MTTFLRIVSALRAYKFRLIMACLCSAAFASLMGVYAWLVKEVLDGILIEKDRFLLAIFPVVLLSVALLKGLVAYGQAYLMSYVGNRVVADIRHQLFQQMIFLPVRYHDDNASGRLVARVLNDVNQMANAIPTVLKDLIQQGLTFFVLLGLVFYLNWQLASVLLIVIPSSLFVVARMGKRLRRLATRGQESIGDMASVLKEAFSGIRIVKAYGTERQEGERFGKTNISFMRANMKSAQLSAITSPLMEMIAVIGIAFIIWFGGQQVVSGSMSPGEFGSFLTAIFMAYAPIRRLAGANSAIQAAIAAAKRVYDVLDLDHEHSRETNKKFLPVISHSLEFHHVSFRYQESADPALFDINLTVRVGEVVALVGTSGSGKTTLVSLVPRFYHPTQGTIVIDGQDIEGVTLTSLRSQMAMVSQDTILFDDTVRNNIAYGKEEAGKEEILAAARSAFAYEFIERLPEGFDTMIGENGVKLSGGQRQRLAIARAILRDPPLLILDEATSSLDSESERVVQAALSSLMKNRTTLVIAHRLSTVQHADRIVVLSGGRILEIGTHEELFQKNGVYKRLCQMQFQEYPGEPVTS